jgi:UDP-N-acetylglucosamine 2-epimerase (non-hydrolysing)
MKKIVLIIGARPNFMKAFPVYEALRNDFAVTLIHTGQHFDEKMSKVFFEQLKFPHPDIHLTLEKRTKAGDFDNKLYVENETYLKNKDVVIEELKGFDGELGQLGEIRDKLKNEFEKIQPDLVMVFGDVTSTLAAGLAAKMLNIKLAHVESGLRSGDIKMPEEVNRILTDHISDYYFVTEQSGVDNLKNEGKTENVYLVGNTMIDTQKKYLQQALNTKYNETLGVKSKEYILVTLRRPSNVDNLEKLKEIFDDFEELSKTEMLVYPIHPRTKKNLEKLGYLEKVESNKNILLQEPLGYLEFTCLIANCKYMITDSGGIQEETTALDIPCFTLRENTERPSTLMENHGTNQLIHKISEIELKECKGKMDLWDGKSSVRVKKYYLNMPIIVTNLCNKPKYIYNHNGYYFNYIVNNNSKNVIFLFSGSYDKNKIDTPYFPRCSWCNYSKKYNYVFISDPTMNFIDCNKHKYNKWEDENLLEKPFGVGFYILDLFQKASKIKFFIDEYIKIYGPFDNIYFSGSSYGGYASLVYGSMYNNINIIVQNPQTNIFNYYDRVCQGIISLCEYLNLKPNYSDLINYNNLKTSRILYIQNLDDDYHFINHYIPFYLKYKAYNEGNSLRIAISNDKDCIIDAEEDAKNKHIHNYWNISNVKRKKRCNGKDRLSEKFYKKTSKNFHIIISEGQHGNVLNKESFFELLSKFDNIFTK